MPQPPQVTSHRSLFHLYVVDLQRARTAAETWWNNVVAAERDRESTGDPEERVRMRWPFGPASHPYVLAVYRKYYIACLDLNNALERNANKLPSTEQTNAAGDSKWGVDTDRRETQKEGPVPPSVFTTDWLFGQHDDLREFIADMVFSPIGIEDMRR